MTNYVDQIDWEKENSEHKYKLEDGSNFLKSERLPALIIVKIKLEKDDNQTNKRTFFGINRKRIQS